MTSLTLHHDKRAELAQLLTDDTWFVACLCAAWCDVCKEFRAGFDQLAARHPATPFIWIDIEDEADVAGDFDVENFPTLLIQRGDAVTFFGTVQPDQRQIERLLLAQQGRTAAELDAAMQARPQLRDLNLRERLAAHPAP